MIGQDWFDDLRNVREVARIDNLPTPHAAVFTWDADGHGTLNVTVETQADAAVWECALNTRSDVIELGSRCPVTVGVIDGGTTVRIVEHRDLMAAHVETTIRLTVDQLAVQASMTGDNR